MKIAVAMKNEQELQTGHFGQALFYNMYEVDGKEYSFIGKRENPHFGKHKHAKAAEIEEVIGDCSVWIGVEMGKGSVRHLCSAGITPFVVQASDPDKAVKEYIRYAMD